MLLLGIDAGDPGLLKHWVASGHLPNLAALLDRGCYWRTGGPDMLFEHGIWLSIISGVSRARHGYHYLRQLRSGTYDLKTPTGCDIDVPYFWERLNSGSRVLVVDVPETRLATDVKGVQICDWAVHDPSRSAAVQPATALAEVERVFGPQVKVHENYAATFADDVAIYRRLLERVAKKGDLLAHLLSRERFDCAVFIFGEAHTGSHQLWKYLPESTIEEKVFGENELTHGIRTIYEAIDREIGRLLKLVPGDTNVFVMTSVGLKESYPTGGLVESFCRQLGYQAAPTATSGAISPMALARRVIPESWRVAVSRHFPGSTREKLVANQFQTGTDWRRTTVFAVPSHYAGFLRFNLKGREPMGTVEPGAECDALFEQLKADLMQLVDPHSGVKAVSRVLRLDEVFGRDRSAELPDVFIEWEPTPYFVQRLVHPRAELRQQRPEFFRGTDHTYEGFVAAAGSAITKRGDQGEVDVLRLAPTFLKLMGQEQAAAMSERPIAL